VVTSGRMLLPPPPTGFLSFLVPADICFCLIGGHGRIPAFPALGGLPWSGKPFLMQTSAGVKRWFVGVTQSRHQVLDLADAVLHCPKQNRYAGCLGPFGP
jgi:hypothetical protein